MLFWRFFQWASADFVHSYGTGQKHWLHLLKARAIENQCFVLAPNQVGEAPNKFKSWGHSLILDHGWPEVADTILAFLDRLDVKP